MPAGSELDFFAASSFKGLGASEEMQAAPAGPRHPDPLARPSSCLQGQQALRLPLRVTARLFGGVFAILLLVIALRLKLGFLLFLYLLWQPGCTTHLCLAHARSSNSACPQFMLHPQRCLSLPYLLLYFTLLHEL